MKIITISREIDSGGRKFMAGLGGNNETTDTIIRPF